MMQEPETSAQVCQHQCWGLGVAALWPQACMHAHGHAAAAAAMAMAQQLGHISRAPGRAPASHLEAHPSPAAPPCMHLASGCTAELSVHLVGLKALHTGNRKLGVAHEPMLLLGSATHSLSGTCMLAIHQALKGCRCHLHLL